MESGDEETTVRSRRSTNTNTGLETENDPLIDNAPPSTDRSIASESWKMFCGFNVRQGTIVIGILEVIVSIGILLSKFDQAKDNDETYYDVFPDGVDFLNLGEMDDQNNECNLQRWLRVLKLRIILKHASFDEDDQSNFDQSSEKVSTSDIVDIFTLAYSLLYLAVVHFSILIIFTLMMIYGAVRYKPGLIIPFICADVIGIIMASVLDWIHPFLNSESAKILPLCQLLLMSAWRYAIMGFKMNIIWRFYKFCKLRHQEMSNVIDSQPSADCRRTEQKDPLLHSKTD